jgi:hypothetical protein
MPTVSIFAPELSGTTGMFVFLRAADDGVLLNPGGDALTESPASSGRFTATVAESINEIHHARIYESGSESPAAVLRDGWIAASGTLIIDGYPSAGGNTGGGGGDATLANQELILDEIDALATQVSTAISGGISVVEFEPLTIVGFPTQLNIGDSYTEDCNASITVYMRDSNDDPITGVGTHAFTDPDFAPSLVISKEGQIARVTATVTFVDAPGAAENYLKVEIPRDQTIRATPGFATMQCLLKWDGAQRTLATQSVEWLPQI